MFSGHVDVHFPVIGNPNFDDSDQPYFFSTATLWKVNFYLYTHKDLSFDMDKLGELNLLTDSAHTEYFDFEIKPSTNMKGAIQMVERKRVDSLIYAEPAIDPLISSLNLKNIKRTYYATYNVKALIHKSDRAGTIDQLLTKAIGKLNRSGELAELTAMLTGQSKD